MSVVNMVVGAPAPDGATFVAKVDGGGPVRVAVADNETMTSPVFTSSQAVDAQGVAKVSITGLTASTRYWWQVEDNSVLDTSITGQFRTLPTLGAQASFTIGAAACAGSLPDFPGVAGGELDPDRVSNHPVWETIRSRAVDEDWALYVNLGDWGYADWGVATTDTLANRRKFYDDNLAQPNQASLWSQVPLVYAWDDHDFGANDSDGTLATKANAASVYRERVPHYPLDDSNGIWQSWQIGRVLCVASDVRYYRDPNTDPDGPSKTMLGTAQKAWLANLLASSDASLLIWFMSSQWLGDSSDGWASFVDERDELVQLLGQHGWLNRVVMVYGDHHALGITGGGTNTSGGFPILQAASIDSSHGGPVDGLFDIGPDTPGRAQYGTVTVEDLGSAIAVTLKGWRDTTELMSFRFGVSVTSPTVVGSAEVVEFAEHVHGSHEPLFEARVLTSFQTGDDPTGTVIPIVSGDVQYDNTADVFATLQLTTGGVDEDDDLESRFPRLAADLFAPYGNEIWVRRGVDLGGEILWSPLGYFRIDAAEQSDAPYGEIALSGQDRMAGIIDARLVVTRTFAATTTVATVFATMVGEVYPDATIVFDDSTGFASIGNALTFEEDRYKPLAELVRAFGKIMYWDGEGILRIESAPDESTPLWEVKAGANGVLISSGRRVSREGVYNGVVARGEGGEQTDPVFAIAVDIGPNSPTKWGGRFGKVPRFYTSPFIKTEAQALSAARAILRRQLGAPYSADFGAVVNPALRPWHPIRVEQRDGNREIHVVQTLSVPLTADTAMGGGTREKTQVLIGQVSS